MTYTVPSRVAHVLGERGDTTGPELFLMRLPDGLPLRLGGTAALIWLVASEGSEDVVSDVAEVVGRLPGDVEQDVIGYLELLVRRGLLEQTGR